MGLANPARWCYLSTITRGLAMDKKFIDRIRKHKTRGSYDPDWREFEKRRAPWETAQFVTADVCEVTGASPKALEHFLNPKRHLVAFDGEALNPGTGKRRMFTGKHVLMIAAAYQMNAIGFPQRASNILTDLVGTRVLGLADGIDPRQGATLIIYPLPDNDYQFRWAHEGDEEPADLPVACWVLDVAKLIDQVRAQLDAIVAGDEVPQFPPRKIGAT